MREKILKDYKIRQLIKSRPPYESRKLLAQRARVETRARQFAHLGDVEDNYISDSHAPPPESLDGITMPTPKTLGVIAGIVVVILAIAKFKA